MKTWKLVSGILSIVFFVIITFQSCAVGIVEAIEDTGGISGSTGILCGFLILAGGIVSVATRKSSGKGGNIAIIILFGLSAIIGLTLRGIYEDLVVWSIWCVVNVVVAIIFMLKNKGNNKAV